MIPLAFDSETALIRPGLQAPPITCVSTWSGAGGDLLDHVAGPATIAAVLECPDVLIVGHNVAFDMVVLAAEVPAMLPAIFAAYEADRVTCTEVRQKLLDIAAGVYRSVSDEDEDGRTVSSQYSLEDLAWRLLRRRLEKDVWRLRYGELRGVPIASWEPGARLYPLEDARATFDVFQAQEDPRALPYLEDQFRQARGAFWLRLMSTWGIQTDHQGVHELAAKTGLAYEKVAVDLRAAGLLRADKVVRRRTGLVEKVPGSRNTKAAQFRIVAAYRALGKEIPLTDGGKSGIRQPSLDETACTESGDPVLVKYAELTSLKAVLSKDVPMLAAGITTPIHSRFEVLKETGRTGSSGPNLQNLRRAPGIRECFVPRCHTCGTTTPRAGGCPGCGGPSYVFISTDYGQLELFTLGQVCYSILGHSSLGDALNAGKDPHLMVASQILGCDYEAARAIRKGSDHRSPEYHQVDNARQTGKVGNFGFPGGLGADAFVAFALSNYGVRLTKSQAVELKRVWISTWREMPEYFRWIDRQVKANPPLLRHLFSNRVRGAVGYTDGCNTMFQGLGGDVAKSAGWGVARACYVDRGSPLFGFRIVNFVHDEFVTEGPEPLAHEAALEQSRIMVDASRPWLPSFRGIEAEPAIMRRYSKEAGLVKDANGRIVPWEP